MTIYLLNLTFRFSSHSIEARLCFVPHGSPPPCMPSTVSRWVATLRENRQEGYRYDAEALEWAFRRLSCWNFERIGSEQLPLFRGDIFLSGLDNLSVGFSGLCTSSVPHSGDKMEGAFIVSLSTQSHLAHSLLKSTRPESTKKTWKKRKVMLWGCILEIAFFLCLWTCKIYFPMWLSKEMLFL